MLNMPIYYNLKGKQISKFCNYNSSGHKGTKRVIKQKHRHQNFCPNLPRLGEHAV